MPDEQNDEFLETSSLDLEAVYKKINDGNYWSGNIWMEMIANNLFNNDRNDHDYCTDKNNDKVEKLKTLLIQDPEDLKTLQYANFTDNNEKIAKDVDFMDLDIQNCVEIDFNEETQNASPNEKNQSFDEQQNSFNSFTTNDSGIDSPDSTFAENEDAFPYSTKIPFTEQLENFRSDQPPETCKRKVSEFEAPAKKVCGPKWSREVLVSEESPVIEGEFEDSRRVTRQLAKIQVDKPVKSVDNTPGKLVWGYFRTCWWPALIIKAEDAGMIYTPGKIWVFWIGESQISELREKNVDSFTNKIETKLKFLAISSKSNKDNKLRNHASFKLIQLLKCHFSGGALVKPYVSWIKKHILPHKNKLDELIFYPYPESVAENLNDLKKVNFEKNEKYLRQREKEQLNKAMEVKISTRKVEKPEKPIEKGGINIMDQKVGMIVWAKMQGYSLWPLILILVSTAMILVFIEFLRSNRIAWIHNYFEKDSVIMDYQHLNRKQPLVAHQWVMWYGDYKYSQVEYRQIFTFPVGMEKMEDKIRAMKDDLFSKAVLQAAKDYCEPIGYLTEPWKLNDVINLFYVSKERFKLQSEELFEPNENDVYSQTIKKQLRKQIKNQPVDEQRKQEIIKNKQLKLVLSGKAELDSLCITCFRTSENLEEHPFFYASMCDQCLDEFRPKMFAYGNDAKCFFCTLCGGDDFVAMCDDMSCPRVFCTACIKYIICPESYEEILLKHPWNCFLCDPISNNLEESIIRIRKDWKKRMISIYRFNCNEKTPSNLERIDRSRKIRVLSLFDGIGTGLVVLRKLNLHIECYYASEIDPDSIQVSFFNHGNKIIQLGDVRDIDEKKIREIAPIDLLIGGSPCNELSLANPKRRGLDDPEGTGVLFYEYCRIKKLVKKYNKKRHLFWLFENVASMPKKFRNQISENLRREPQFIDSADFSAQHRPRLYWGNLPWGPYQINDVILQDMLKKHCNRQALVKKIMTVTTRVNSLTLTKANLRPVLMNGKKDMLWVTELEEIFGFPRHYTDANITKTRRLQLIGKAWSVQTLTAILRPLFYF